MPDVMFMATLNIGLSIQGEERPMQLPHTLSILNGLTRRRSGFAFRIEPNKKYDGHTERTIVVRAALCPKNLEAMCLALGQECIAIKYDDPDLNKKEGGRLVWSPMTEPRFEFSNDHFTDW